MDVPPYVEQSTYGDHLHQSLCKREPTKLGMIILLDFLLYFVGISFAHLPLFLRRRRIPIIKPD